MLFREWFKDVQKRYGGLVVVFLWDWTLIFVGLVNVFVR